MSSIIKPVENTAGSKRVVVIGAGVTGALCSWELARSGHTVTVLEARAVGSGSSSRSAACIRQQFGTPSTVRGMRYSTRFYTEWGALGFGDQSPIHQNGYLFLKDYSTNIAAVQARVAMQQREGLTEVEWLDRASLEMRFPHIENTGLVGATWCPTDGFLLPNIVYNDAMEKARELGVKLLSGVEVLNGVTMPSGITLFLDDGSQIEADVVVNATNAWAPNISSVLGGFPLPILTRRRYLYFLRGLAQASSLLDVDVASLPMTISPRGCYCRPEPSGQLMMGWLHHTPPEKPGFDDQDSIDGGYGAREPGNYGTAMHKELLGYFPAIEGMGQIESVTAGYYADTGDHNPLIGFDPWVQNLIHVAGFSGHGLMHGPFSARIVAELVASGSNLDRVCLPLDLGEAELAPYRVDRTMSGGESEVI